MTDKLERCRCDHNEVCEVCCPTCFDLPPRMQSPETFTRAEVIDLIKLVPWRSGYEPEEILAEFLAARRKP